MSACDPLTADIGLLSVAMRPVLMLLGATNSSDLDNPIEYEANWVRRTYWPLEVSVIYCFTILSHS